MVAVALTGPDGGLEVLKSHQGASVGWEAVSRIYVVFTEIKNTPPLRQMSAPL